MSLKDIQVVADLRRRVGSLGPYLAMMFFVACSANCPLGAENALLRRPGRAVPAAPQPFPVGTSATFRPTEASTGRIRPWPVPNLSLQIVTYRRLTP